MSLLTSLHAADLVTREGKIYHDYKIVGHDDGYLTILFSDGGATLLLKDLPDDMQQQCGYDPVKAEAFVRQHNAIDAQQRMAVQQAQTTGLNGTPADNAQNDQAIPEARSDDPSNTPAPSMAAASKTDTASDTFNTGMDPLDRNTQILHTHDDQDRQDEAASDDAPPGAVISDEGDPSGYWFIYTDPRGMRHRDFRLRNHIHFGPGQWVVFVDRQGIRHREFHQMHDRTASTWTNKDLRHTELPNHNSSTTGNHSVTSSPSATRVVNAPSAGGSGGSYRPAAAPSYTPAARPSFGGAGR